MDVGVAYRRRCTGLRVWLCRPAILLTGSGPASVVVARSASVVVVNCCKLLWYIAAHKWQRNALTILGLSLSEPVVLAAAVACSGKVTMMVHLAACPVISRRYQLGLRELKWR